MPLCPQITNTPITVSYNSTDYILDNVQDVQTTTTTFYAAPTPTAQAVGDIWFDTSNGNKQYRWSGSSWTAVQDTAIPAAYSLASTANSNASTAISTANGKNIVTYSTSSYSGSGTRQGDIWFQYQSGTGVILAQWTWNGSSWDSTTLSDSVIASITAGKITAGTITVALGITNPSGNFTVDASTGKLTATGVDISGRITASSGTFTGAVYASSGSFTGSITSTSGSIGGFTIDPTGFSSPSYSWSLTSTGTLSGGNSNTLYYGYVNIGGGSSSGQRLYVTGNSAFVGDHISTGNITTQGYFYTPYHLTTSSAANGYVNASTGVIARSTASSQRYKEDIVNLVDVSDLDPKKLYDLPVRAFRYKAEYLDPKDDRFGVLMPGFIAEEVDAIYPIAADYLDGAESWNDRMLVPAMLALIQDLNSRITKLGG
jgi:Chaperone of endosialidase